MRMRAPCAKESAHERRSNKAVRVTPPIVEYEDGLEGTQRRGDGAHDSGVVCPNGRFQSGYSADSVGPMLCVPWSGRRAPAGGTSPRRGRRRQSGERRTAPPRRSGRPGGAYAAAFVRQGEADGARGGVAAELDREGGEVAALLVVYSAARGAGAGGEEREAGGESDRPLRSRAAGTRGAPA